MSKRKHAHAPHKANRKANPAFGKVNTLLFNEDIAELKRRAVESGMLEWQPKLRQLVHEALASEHVVWKFLIPGGENDWRALKSNPAHSYKGCAAVVVAPDEKTAREVLAIHGAEAMRDVRWLEVADVIKMTLETPKVLSFVML